MTLAPPLEQLSKEIVELILRLDNPTRADINRAKLDICKKYKSPTIPPNSSILELIPGEQSTKFNPLLQGKSIRSSSGVTIVAVMPKPYTCPHGKCTYCPGGPEIGVPRAYTGKEPAVMRALETGYDPALQVKARIKQLEAIGHKVDKVELILVGGTFTFLPEDYQQLFVRQCLDALNGVTSETLAEAKTKAETARTRNVGITVETRPDWSKRKHVDHMLSLGITRVEIGVQTLYDDVYNNIHRDHTVEDVKEATQVLKDSALKVGYHMMLGLPGTNPQRDIEAFRRLWSDESFRPDMLKIYPCLVTPGTQLYEEWKSGAYQPYCTDEAARLIVEIKKEIPRWVRIMRIQREIPADGIADGVRNGNLREMVQAELSKQGVKCCCIRCREVGHSSIEGPIGQMESSMSRIDYGASEGWEVFLSCEAAEQDVLLGYARLRIPGPNAHRGEIRRPENSGLIRELHVLGQTVPVGQAPGERFQHKGYGTKLLAEAERIAREEFDLTKMVVISALGTKQYYARSGYANDGPYVSKALN